MDKFAQFDGLLKELAPHLNGTYRHFRGIEEGEYRAAESLVSKSFNKVANPILSVFGVMKSAEQIRKNYEKHYASGIIDFEVLASGEIPSKVGRVGEKHKISLQSRNTGFGLEGKKPFQIQIRCAIKSSAPFLISLGSNSSAPASGADNKTVFFGIPAHLKPLMPQGFVRRQAGAPDYGHRIKLADSAIADHFELVANPQTLGESLAASTTFGELLAGNSELEVLTAGFGDSFGSGSQMIELLAAVDCDGPQVLAQAKLVIELLRFLEEEKVI